MLHDHLQIITYSIRQVPYEVCDGSEKLVLDRAEPINDDKYRKYKL